MAQQDTNTQVDGYSSLLRVAAELLADVAAEDDSDTAGNDDDGTSFDLDDSAAAAEAANLVASALRRLRARPGRRHANRGPTSADLALNLDRTIFSASPIAPLSQRSEAHLLAVDEPTSVPARRAHDVTRTTTSSPVTGGIPRRGSTATVAPPPLMTAGVATADLSTSSMRLSDVEQSLASESHALERVRALIRNVTAPLPAARSESDEVRKEAVALAATTAARDAYGVEVRADSTSQRSIALPTLSQRVVAANLSDMQSSSDRPLRLINATSRPAAIIRPLMPLAPPSSAVSPPTTTAVAAVPMATAAVSPPTTTAVAAVPMATAAVSPSTTTAVAAVPMATATQTALSAEHSSRSEGGAAREKWSARAPLAVTFQASPPMDVPAALARHTATAAAVSPTISEPPQRPDLKRVRLAHNVLNVFPEAGVLDGPTNNGTTRVATQAVRIPEKLSHHSVNSPGNSATLATGAVENTPAARVVDNDAAAPAVEGDWDAHTLARRIEALVSAASRQRTTRSATATEGNKSLKSHKWEAPPFVVAPHSRFDGERSFDGARTLRKDDESTVGPHLTNGGSRDESNIPENARARLLHIVSTESTAKPPRVPKAGTSSRTVQRPPPVASARRTATSSTRSSRRSQLLRTVGNVLGVDVTASGGASALISAASAAAEAAVLVAPLLHFADNVCETLAAEVLGVTRGQGEKDFTTSADARPPFVGLDDAMVLLRCALQELRLYRAAARTDGHRHDV